MKIPSPMQQFAQMPEDALGDIDLEPTSAVHPFAVTNLTGTVNVLDVPDGEFWRIDQFSIYNSDAATADISAWYIIPSGATFADTNRVGRVSLAAYETISLPWMLGVVLAPGTVVQAFSVEDTTNVFGGVTRFFRGQRRD